MADGLFLDVSGLKEIDQALADLGEVAGEKVMRSSMFAASKPILDRTHAGLSVIPGSGALKKATRRVYMKSGPTSATAAGVKASGARFVIAIAPKRKDQTAVAIANLKYKRRRRIRAVIWGHLLEWGHRIANGTTGRLTRAVRRRRTRLHAGLGRVPGRHIFQSAAAAAAPEAIATFRKVIVRRIDQALKRAGKLK